MSAFETMLNRIVEFLPRVLGAAIIIFAGWLLKMLIMRIISKILKKKVEPLMHMFIKNSTVILIWIVIIRTNLSIPNVKWRRLSIISGIAVLLCGVTMGVLALLFSLVIMC